MPHEVTTAMGVRLPRDVTCSAGLRLCLSAMARPGNRDGRVGWGGGGGTRWLVLGQEGSRPFHVLFASVVSVSPKTQTYPLPSSPPPPPLLSVLRSPQLGVESKSFLCGVDNPNSAQGGWLYHVVCIWEGIREAVAYSSSIIYQKITRLNGSAIHTGM